jgi:hypothetical protein
MFRGATSTGRLIKWLAAPALVVQRTGLLWANSPTDRYLAEDEQWTDGDIDTLIADLTFGLQTISAGVFPAFSAIRVEQAAAGTMVTVPQAGAIVVARYRSLHGSSGDRIGSLGKTNTDAAGVIRGGMIMLDRGLRAGATGLCAQAACARARSCHGNEPRHLARLVHEYPQHRPAERGGHGSVPRRRAAASRQPIAGRRSGGLHADYCGSTSA